MERITIEDYFGPYLNGGEDTVDMRASAARLLAAVNVALELAVGDGVVLLVNPKTGSYVSGSGNGGFRGKASSVGAPSSSHRSAEAVDLYDPYRVIAAWCIKNRARLEALGILGMERPEWTSTWCHLQTVRVHSGTWCFVPDRSAPIAETLPEEYDAGIA